MKFERILERHDDAGATHVVLYLIEDNAASADGSSFYVTADPEGHNRLTKEELYDAFLKGCVVYTPTANIGYPEACMQAVYVTPVGVATNTVAVNDDDTYQYAIMYLCIPNNITLEAPINYYSPVYTAVMLVSKEYRWDEDSQGRARSNP